MLLALNKAITFFVYQLYNCPKLVATFYWKTFVGSRVAKIQSLTSVSDWKHVRTHDNPADHVSRGTDPQCLASLDQWWFGRDWMKSECSSYTSVVEVPEVKTFPATVLIVKPSAE
jgi:hypothetical protein